MHPRLPARAPALVHTSPSPPPHTQKGEVDLFERVNAEACVNGTAHYGASLAAHAYLGAA